MNGEWKPVDICPDDEVVLLAAEFDGPGDWRIKCGYKDELEDTGFKIWGASWVPTHWMPLPEPPKC